MRAAALVLPLLIAFPVAAQTARPPAPRDPGAHVRSGPETPTMVLDATLIVGEPPSPSFRQEPRAPEPGRRRALPLRADFRAAVLSSAGAL